MMSKSNCQIGLLRWALLALTPGLLFFLLGASTCFLQNFARWNVGLLAPQRQDSADRPPWETGSFEPSWANAKATRTVEFIHQDSDSDEVNGQRLARTMRDLQPGDRLLIGHENFVLSQKLVLNLVGTNERPIRIEAADPVRPPVIKRDARQNIFNVGAGRRCEYVLMRGLELTGGSTAIRLHDVGNIWIDKCHIHHSQHGGLTANTHDSDQLFITSNHLHDFHEGTAEAMYLGHHKGDAVMTNSVIANYHVHDCTGTQGDGIEVKQGSFSNWVVGNKVHDTKSPCIIAYGTNGKGVNVVERNICYRCKDNVMQIQGEAVVRNNLLLAGGGAGFSSHDHMGKSRLLTVVHNTIITNGIGANLSS